MVQHLQREFMETNKGRGDHGVTTIADLVILKTHAEKFMVNQQIGSQLVPPRESHENLAFNNVSVAPSEWSPFSKELMEILHKLLSQP